MMQSVLPYLMRVICLILVIATGTSGIANADHGGSHGSHCITAVQDEELAPHDHTGGTTAASHHEAEGQNCVQHSCVAVVGSLNLMSHSQQLLAGNTVPHGDLLRASMDAGSLHRPPIA